MWNFIFPLFGFQFSQHFCKGISYSFFKLILFTHHVRGPGINVTQINKRFSILRTLQSVLLKISERSNFLLFRLRHKISTKFFIHLCYLDKFTITFYLAFLANFLIYHWWLWNIFNAALVILSLAALISSTKWTKSREITYYLRFTFFIQWL